MISDMNAIMNATKKIKQTLSRLKKLKVGLGKGFIPYDHYKKNEALAFEIIKSNFICISEAGTGIGSTAGSCWLETAEANAQELINNIK